MSNSGLIRSSQRAAAVLLGVDGRIVEEVAHGSSDPVETEDAASIVEQARLHADELVRTAATQSTTLQHDALEQGRADGYRDGVASARAELAEALALVQRAAREAKAIRDALLNGAEREMIELVIEAIGRILGEHVATDPDLVVHTVRRALDHAGSQNVLRLRVHTDDLQTLTASVGEQYGASPPFEVLGDNSVSVGGCVIDTDSGEIDARLDVQLEEIASILRDAIPDGAPAAAVDPPRLRIVDQGEAAGG